MTNLTTTPTASKRRYYNLGAILIFCVMGFLVGQWIGAGLVLLVIGILPLLINKVLAKFSPTVKLIAYVVIILLIVAGIITYLLLAASTIPIAN